MNDTDASPAGLARVVGVPGAVLLGLGSILGTGIFVGLGLAAGATGAAVLLAIVVAALVATCNGLSSAQLAARHPTSGGTYEYGRRRLSPAAGFAAGWMFLCAKSASAATAALAIAGHLAELADVDAATIRTVIALIVVAAATALVAGGLRRSAAANAVLVTCTLAALGLLALGAVRVGDTDAIARPFAAWSTRGFLEAAALIFVAFTGYGRVATLGEEIRDPARNIPRAIVLTLAATTAIYLVVGAAALALVPAEALARSAVEDGAPLASAARTRDLGVTSRVLELAAVTAMGGVLLNLVLGLSRVLLAMARGGDAPAGLAHVAAGATPRRAVAAVGVLVGSLAAIGDLGLTWSFSAFTVLLYYGITNAAALRLADDERLAPRWVSWCGLIACLGLAAFVELAAIGAGLVLLALGLGARALARRR